MRHPLGDPQVYHGKHKIQTFLTEFQTPYRKTDGTDFMSSTAEAGCRENILKLQVELEGQSAVIHGRDGG